MRRSIGWKGPLSILAVLGMAGAARAETAEDVVRRYVAARGGLEKIKAIESFEEAITTFQMGHELAGRMLMKRPARFRLEMTLQNKTMVRAYDGKMAWEAVPFHGSPEPQQIAADEARPLIDQADFDGPLVDFGSKGNRIELVGREDVDGAPADKLRVTSTRGEVSYLYIDAETGLKVKQISRRRQLGSEVEVETYLTDYRAVDGVFFPFSIDSRVGGKSAGRVLVHDIKLNVPLDDKIFAMPAR
jgi:hypothetical protein